jgi:NAD(P)-dependent dehydrogenase (short-subunit alcohol dehydrogenase family)
MRLSKARTEFTMKEHVSRLMLVTGVTGYVGGRLVPRLLEAGYRVRCLVRDPSRLQGRPWLDQVDVVQGDVLRPDSLPAAITLISSPGLVWYLFSLVLAVLPGPPRAAKAAASPIAR